MPGAAATVPEPALEVRSTRVSDDGLSAVVFVSSPVFLRTSSVPGIAEELLGLMPGLVRHPCDSGSPHGIAAELADTESPHLVEHVALELLALAGLPRRELIGRTSWDFARDGAGVFHVSMTGAPGVASEAALRQAVAIVSDLLCEPEHRPSAEDIATAQEQVRLTCSRARW